MSTPVIFLKLEVKGKAVPGDAEMAGYEGEIEIESMSWDVTAEHPGMTSSQKARTEVRAKVLKLSKFFDKSSTNLCKHMASYELFTTATITVLTMTLGGTGGKNLKLMRMQLSDGHIESVDVSASESSKSMTVKETVTLSFRKCKLMYYPTDVTKPGREAPTTFELEAASIGA